MKAVLLAVLACVTLALANQVAQVATIHTQNKANCNGQCTFSQICLGCQDGSSACFSSSYSSYTCCGCSVGGFCRACAPGDLCARDSFDSTGYTCQVRVDVRLPGGAIAGIVIGGFVFIFIVALIIACIRRRYATYETVTYGTTYGANVYAPPTVVVSTSSYGHHHHHGHHSHHGAVGYQASYSSPGAVGFSAGNNGAVGYQAS